MALFLRSKLEGLLVFYTLELGHGHFARAGLASILNNMSTYYYTKIRARSYGNTDATVGGLGSSPSAS